jgi:hypothetical protein
LTAWAEGVAEVLAYTPDRADALDAFVWRRLRAMLEERRTRQRRRKA